MEPTTGTGNKKAIIVGILGFLVGCVVSFLFLSGRISSRSSLSASSTEAGGTIGGQATQQVEIPQAETSGTATGKNDAGTSGHANEKTVVRGGMVAGNSLSVSDQRAGESVSISEANTDKRGWIVIHQDDHGAPGWVLGAKRLEPGSYSNISVELLRATTPGSVYYAMLHNDDGVDTFDLHKDLPVTDAPGNPVMMRFQTTGE